MNAIGIPPHLAFQLLELCSFLRIRIVAISVCKHDSLGYAHISSTPTTAVDVTHLYPHLLPPAPHDTFFDTSIPTPLTHTSHTSPRGALSPCLSATTSYRGEPKQKLDSRPLGKLGTLSLADTAHPLAFQQKFLSLSQFFSRSCFLFLAFGSRQIALCSGSARTPNTHGWRMAFERTKGNGCFGCFTAA